MCFTTTTEHVCGHKKRTIEYCSHATRHPLTRRKRKCTTNPQPPCYIAIGCLCHRWGCNLSRLGAYWKCCSCSQGPNTHRVCNSSIDIGGKITECDHAVCGTCTRYRYVLLSGSVEQTLNSFSGNEKALVHQVVGPCWFSVGAKGKGTQLFLERYVAVKVCEGSGTPEVNKETQSLAQLHDNGRGAHVYHRVI